MRRRPMLVSADEGSGGRRTVGRGDSGLKAALLEQALDHKSKGLVQGFGHTANGFLDNRTRVKCWHTLLQGQLEELVAIGDKNEEPAGRPADEAQVDLDVARSFSSITNDKTKAYLRQILKEVIVTVLQKYPDLHYYQGYHDVVAVFVMVFVYGLEPKGGMVSQREHMLIVEDVERFTLLYLRDFMTSSLDFTIDQLKLIPYLLKKMDGNTYHKLNMEHLNPLFAISSVLTLFAHDLTAEEGAGANSAIYQIYDIIIASQTMLLPLVLFCHIIMSQKDTIIKNYEMNSEIFDTKQDLVHVTMQQVLQSSLADNGILLCSLIPQARDFCKSIWKTDTRWKKFVNPYSVLVNTASGRDIKPFPIKDVLNFLKLEIELDQKVQRDKVKIARKRALLAYYKKYIFRGQSYPLIYISLLIGFVAVLIHYSKPETIHLKSAKDVLSSLWAPDKVQGSKEKFLKSLKDIIKKYMEGL